MTSETQPLTPPAVEPTQEMTSEMSFRAAIWRAIDDLFVSQAIAEKVQQIPANDVLPVLLETWKQGLANRLLTEAQSTVTHVAAILNVLQSAEAISTMDPLEWQQAEHWYAPFPVASVCREDLRGVLTDKDITRLSDDDMIRIADKMNDAFHNTDVYRLSLEITARSVLTEIQEQDQPPEPEVATPQSKNLAS
jgi:hypothetical protein